MTIHSAQEFSCHSTKKEPLKGFKYRSGIRFTRILFFLITHVVTKKRLDELGKTESIATNQEPVR